MSDKAICNNHPTKRVPFVDNCTVSRRRIKNHVDGVSWRRLRVANMPIQLWIALLAALLGVFFRSCFTSSCRATLNLLREAR
jgi:hypothetical protein